MLDADALDAVLDVGQAGKTRHQPAVAETTLLDVGAADVSQEGGLVVDLVNTLDSLWYCRVRVHQGRHAEVELVAAEAVEAVTFFHLKVPVLREGGSVS